MRNKLLISYFVLSLIMLTTFIWIIGVSSRATLQNQMTQNFLNEIHLIELTIDDETWTPEKAQDFIISLNLGKEQRITIVDLAGVVLADNYENPKQMDNHLMRPEIQAAVTSKGYGSQVRQSATIRQEAIYVAQYIEIGDKPYILRLSKPFELVKEFNRYITQNTLIAIFIVALLVWAMAFFLSKRLTDPIIKLKYDVNRIAEGEYENQVYTAQTDEIGQLGDAFNIMRQNLLMTMSDLGSRNAELNAILNSMVSGIIAVDTQRQIMMINQTAREILALSESVPGILDSMYKIIRNDEIIEMINASIEMGHEDTRELYHVHLEKTLRVTIHPILTDGRNILGSMIVIEDITQIKRLENMRSDFVSNVSHELKTPLTSIMGFVDTLKSGAIKDTDRAMRFLDIIENESERLNRLISDILMLSEIESGTRNPESTKIDVEELIDEVLAMLQLRLDKKPVKLDFEVHESVSIYANRDHLKQLLINIIDNAIKYTEIGFVNVILDRDDRNMILTVEDSGIGISEEHKARLFERFYRVDKARSRKVGGTGLGLSIVKHIVSQYKGDIVVKSKPGEGSTFIVNLPITGSDR